MWGWHKADGGNPFLSWQGKAFYHEVFLPSPRAGGGDRGSFMDLAQEVHASQWLQAEGYRYTFQAARRRKWHRSAMAMWTFNEPWPNAVHGSILDYRGRPKHAYWWVKQAMAMLDVSLEYYSLVHVADGHTSHAVALWVDSELATPSPACCVHLEHFYVNGTMAAPTEVHALPGGAVAPARATRLGAVRTQLPSASVGEVVLARVSLLDVDGTTVRARHTYAFSFVGHGVNTSAVEAPLHSMLTAPSAQLSLSATRQGSSVALSVLASAAAAHYVELTLCDAAGTKLPFVTVTQNLVTMLPGEHIDTMATVLWDGGLAGTAWQACAEAWNAKRACLSFK